MLNNPILAKRPSMLRGMIARGIESQSAAAPPVDREGGDEGAGIIRGYAVATRGEALGHDLWLDGSFLRQVADGINAAGDVGIKSRFTHPGLSADGLGKYLGRTKSAVVDGDVVRADLHFSPSAHAAPDGDLADYVMTLAEADPGAFGSSIVFAHDSAAEDRFRAEHGGSGFQSPDPLNKKNLIHARMKSLRAVDAVDDPAANPNGLFHRKQEFAEEAEAFLSYSLGLTNEAPSLAQFEVDPDRARAFAARFLASRGLSLISTPAPAFAVGDRVRVVGQPHMEGQGEGTVQLVTMEPTYGVAFDGMEEMGIHRWYVESEIEAATAADSNTLPSEEKPMSDMSQSASANKDSASTREEFAAELKRFVDLFGADGASWFAEGKSREQAMELFIAKQAELLAAKDRQVAELTARLASLDRGEKQPVEFSDAVPTADQKRLAKLQRSLGDGLGRFAAAIRLPDSN